MEPNNPISLLVSSRELDRKNPGNLNVLLTSLKHSLHNVENVEVIFKFDEDDTIIENQLHYAASNNPELSIKYFFSPRYGYLGLHKAYYECIECLNDKSYIIIPMADDFIFKKNSYWDKFLLDKTANLTDKPFIVQDDTKVGKMHDVPIFSKKIVELVTLGNSLSVDGFLIELCNIYLDLDLTEYIVTLPEFTSRTICEYDFGPERWDRERKQLIQYLDSSEHADFLSETTNKIKNYFKI